MGHHARGMTIRAVCTTRLYYNVDYNMLRYKIAMEFFFSFSDRNYYSRLGIAVFYLRQYPNIVHYNVCTKTTQNITYVVRRSKIHIPI